MRMRITRLYFIEANDIDLGRGLVDWRGIRAYEGNPPGVYLSAREAHQEMKVIWLSERNREAAKPKVVVFRKVKVR